MSKKIIIDGRWIAPNMRGIGIFTMQYLKELSSGNFECMLYDVAVKKKNIEFVRSNLGDVFNYILLPDAPDPILDFFIFPYILVRNNYSLIHYTGNTGFIYKFQKTKSIVTLHDVSFLKTSKQIPRPNKLRQFIGRLYRSLFTQYCLKSAKSIVTVSNFAKNDIKSHFPKLTNLSYVYHGVEGDSYSLLTNSIPKNDYLIIGGIDPQKNIKSAMEAFIKFRKYSKANVQLKIVGVSQSEYMLHNSTYQKSDFIEFLGYQNHERTLTLLRSSKCLIVCSLYESFCFPVVEAMLSSVDVIGSNTGAIPEIGKDYIEFFFNPYDVDSIFLALTDYEASTLRNRRLSSAYLRNKYSWAKVVNHYLDTYKNALSY